MEFDREFRYRISRAFHPFLVTVPLAFLLQNYWALLIGGLGGFHCRRAELRVAPLPPRFSLAAFREMMAFFEMVSAHQYRGSPLWADGSLIIGKWSGPSAVGAYTLAADGATSLTRRFPRPCSGPYSRATRS